MGWQVIKEEDPNARDFDLYWNDLTTDSAFLMQMKCYQKVNHFSASYHIARKSFLAKNLKRL